MHDTNSFDFDLIATPQEARDRLPVLRAEARIPPIKRRDLRQEVDRCRQDIPRFGKVFFPQYVPVAYAPHHYDIFAVVRVRGRLVVLLLPRGSGKTTLLHIIKCHAVVYGYEPYIVQIEHDFALGQAEAQKMVEAFMSNSLLLAAFPHIRPGTPWKPGSGELYFTNGVKVRFLGMNQLERGSTYQENRVTMAIGNDWVDLHSARSATTTQFQYDLMTKDIAHSGPPPGSPQPPLRYCYLGTSISQTDVAWRFASSTMARVIKRPAMYGDLKIIKTLMQVIEQDAGNIDAYCQQLEDEHIEDFTWKLDETDRWAYVSSKPKIYEEYLHILQSYWPEMYSIPYFIFQAANDTAAFMQEMMHETGDTQFLLFRKEWITNYAHVPGSMEAFVFGLAVDPSCTQEDTRRNDPAALVAGCFCPRTRQRYILHVTEDWLTPDKFCYAIFEILNKDIGPFFEGCGPVLLKNTPGFRLYFEANQAQVFGITLLEQIAAKELAYGVRSRYPDGSSRPQRYRSPEFWRIPDIKKIIQTRNKLDRINATRGEFVKRKYFFCLTDSQQKLLYTQYGGYQGEQTHGNVPLERKLDGMDTLTMLDEQLTKWQKSRGGSERMLTGRVSRSRWR